MSGHRQEIDPVTGYETTGHDWNGIRELNTPFPRIVIWALALAFAYSIVAWVLLPAWPTGRDFTRGLLGLDQGEVALSRLERLDRRRADWLARFETADFAALASDEALMARAMPAAARLFRDNCAACHGEGGKGGPGFPNLADDHWLWGGSPEAIAETIRVGINSTHAETRYAQMPAFGKDGMLAPAELAALTDHVVALGEGTSEPDGEGAAIFAENCAACHGEGGAGGLENGAPSLVDRASIYGQDRETVWRTLQGGRAGVMPHWQERLGEAEIHLLAIFVAGIGSGAPAAEASR
jgi:cytochrome c oxidase cbb3-type subunit 3